VSPIPGPCAVTTALCVSGLPTDRFQFAGFPPSRSSARQKWLAPMAGLAHTLVLYESPHRILESLNDIALVMGGDRPVTLARELTKRFETVLHGTLSEVIDIVTADTDQQRGEFVIIIGSASLVEDSAVAEAADLDKTISVLLRCDAKNSLRSLTRIETPVIPFAPGVGQVVAADHSWSVEESPGSKGQGAR